MYNVLIFVVIVLIIVTVFVIFVNNKKKAVKYPNLPKWYDGDYFKVKSTYPFKEINYLYCTDNDKFWSIQANNGTSLTDFTMRTIVRIDIPYDGFPDLELNQTFSINDNATFPKFKGEIMIFNGELSTSNKVVSGIITFTPDSIKTKYVKGNFDVVLIDGGQWNVSGEFCFLIDKSLIRR
jgi:hypothetical protein